MARKVTWKKGRGGEGHKGQYASMKKGKTYYSEPTWSWLVKNVKRPYIVVRWWVGSSSHSGEWHQQEFTAKDLSAAKRVAKQMAEEFGWGAYVYGRGGAYDPLYRSMEDRQIFDFGEWSSWKQTINPLRGMPGRSVKGCIALNQDKRSPGAYCAAIADRIEPGWRSKRRKKNPMSYDIEKRELELYIDNDRDLYRQREAIEKNLKRKVKSGKYDPTKAPKLWQYMVDAGAKKFVGEFGGNVRTMFPKKMRTELATEYARDWERENKTTNPRRANPRKMTKVEATKEFEEMVIPGLEAHEGEGPVDKPIRRLAWNGYVDALHKEGSITSSQASTWVMPKKFERKRNPSYAVKRRVKRIAKRTARAGNPTKKITKVEFLKLKWDPRKSSGISKSKITSVRQVGVLYGAPVVVFGYSAKYPGQSRAKVSYRLARVERDAAVPIGPGFDTVKAATAHAVNNLKVDNPKHTRPPKPARKKRKTSRAKQPYSRKKATNVRSLVARALS